MNKIQELIESKRNKAEESLKPIFEKVSEKVVEQMKQSSNLYPTVVISWTAKNPAKVITKCEDNVSQLSVEVIDDVSIVDAISYVNDLASTREFSQFSVETSHPINKHYGKEVKVLEGIEIKITLKTLF